MFRRCITAYVLVVAAAVALVAAPVEVVLDDTVFATSTLPLKTHANYLVMDVPHRPVLELCKAVETAIGRRLKNRGEAHVTVVTPPEYDGVLKGFVPIERIHQLAEHMAIQDMDLDVVCLGSGRAGDDEVFFTVVRSEGLVALRQEVERRYLKAGGTPGRFDARAFYPHITVGFTKRDLHLHDGVVKDESSADPRFRLVVGP